MTEGYQTGGGGIDLLAAWVMQGHQREGAWEWTNEPKGPGMTVLTRGRDCPARGFGTLRFGGDPKRASQMDPQGVVMAGFLH